MEYSTDCITVCPEFAHYPPTIYHCVDQSSPGCAALDIAIVIPLPEDADDGLSIDDDLNLKTKYNTVVSNHQDDVISFAEIGRSLDEYDFGPSQVIPTLFFFSRYKGRKSVLTSNRGFDRRNIIHLNHQFGEIPLKEKRRSPMSNEYDFGPSQVIPTLCFSRYKGKKELHVTRNGAQEKNNRGIQNQHPSKKVPASSAPDQCRWNIANITNVTTDCLFPIVEKTETNITDVITNYLFPIVEETATNITGDIANILSPVVVEIQASNSSDSVRPVAMSPEKIHLKLKRKEKRAFAKRLLETVNKKVQAIEMEFGEIILPPHYN